MYTKVKIQGNSLYSLFRVLIKQNDNVAQELRDKKMVSICTVYMIYQLYKLSPWKYDFYVYAYYGLASIETTL